MSEVMLPAKNASHPPEEGLNDDEWPQIIEPGNWVVVASLGSWRINIKTNIK